MAGAVLDTTSPATPAEASGAPDQTGKDRQGGFWALVGRHRMFSVLLTVGVLLRIDTMLGYHPAMWFNDSFDYLHVAMSPYPHAIRPDGYAFFLLLLRPFHSFALVVGLQHLMGVTIGVVIYALLRGRFALPAWGAALAAAPVLLDAYQIQLEHLVLSDVPFTFLVILAIAVLLWRANPSWKIGAAVGLLLGMASLTRSVGLPVLLAVVVYLIARRVRWRVIAATVALCGLPMAAYSVWFHAYYGKFAMTESSGVFLYARVYKFADCDKIQPPNEEIPLCVQPDHKLPFSQDGIWNRRSPLHRVPAARFTQLQNRMAGDFAKRAIMAQPGDYLKVVAGDFFRVFKWNRTVFPDSDTYEEYEFRTHTAALPDWRMSQDKTADQEAAAYERGRASTQITEPFGQIIRVYQDLVYLRGTILGGILLVGLAGMIALWRRFGGPALLPWMTAVGLLLAPAATAEFDYRYILPATPLACIAAALAFAPEVRARYPNRLRQRRGVVAADNPPGDASGSPEPDEEPAAREPAATAQ
ncbi:MAG TPA: hypothetical protein VF069_10770 [Streptosporangiaceae bacterium]